MKQKRRLYYRVLIAVMLAGVSVSQTVAAEENGTIEVDDYAFCTSVENHEPINREKTFSAHVGRVYLWTLITGIEKPIKIKHVWYYGDKRMNKVKLDIPFERTRTWSYKTVLPSQTGDWYVDIIDCDGNLLKQVSFRITE